MAYSGAANLDFLNSYSTCERLRSRFVWDKKSVLWELCDISYAFGLSAGVNSTGESSEPLSNGGQNIPVERNYVQEYESLLDYDFVNSHKFNAGCHSENYSNWSVSLCKRLNSNFIGMFLHLLAIENESQVNCRRSNDESFETPEFDGLFIRYCFSVISQAGTVLKKIDNPTTIHMKIGDSWGEDSFILMETLKDPNSHFIWDDTLRIKIDLWIFQDCNNEIVNIFKHEHPVASGVPHGQLGIPICKRKFNKFGLDKENSDKRCSASGNDDVSEFVNPNTIMKTLWASRDFADVNIKCGDEVFKVHKCVLCAASPVFKAMFASGMDETLRNEISISDISSEVMDVFIQYIYTGRMPDTWNWGNSENMSEILNACEKYQVQELKETCGKALVEYMMIENVGDSAVLVDLFFSGNTLLQELVYTFIARNLTTLRQNVSFQRAVESHPSAFSKFLLSDSLKNIINF